MSGYEIACRNEADHLLEAGNDTFLKAITPLCAELICSPVASMEAGTIEICSVADVSVDGRFSTDTLALPMDATSAAEISAVTSVVETHVVGRGDPFQRATAPRRKFWP